MTKNSNIIPSEGQEKAYAAAWLSRFEEEKAGNYEALKESAGIGSGRLRIWWRAAGIAAAIALGIVSGALIQHRRDLSAERLASADRQTQISVPDGSRMRVRLPDGTEVWLNSGSELSYDGAFRSREVSLEGEGMFKVVHDASRPFTVRTADMDVTVLGTVFNLRSYRTGDNPEVSLIDGSISVLGRTSGQVKVLSPDQKAIIDRETGLVTVEETDAARSAMWTSGRLHFTDSTLPALLHDIERMKGVRFDFDSRILEGELFTGNIRLDQSVDAILRNIDLDRKLVWTQRGEVIEISEKPHR